MRDVSRVDPVGLAAAEELDRRLSSVRFSDRELVEIIRALRPLEVTGLKVSADGGRLRASLRAGGNAIRGMPGTTSAFLIWTRVTSATIDGRPADISGGMSVYVLRYALGSQRVEIDVPSATTQSMSARLRLTCERRRAFRGGLATEGENFDRVAGIFEGDGPPADAAWTETLERDLVLGEAVPAEGQIVP